MGVQRETQMEKRSPIYVTLEGVDCAGKTTLAANLCETLPRRGISAAIKAEFIHVDRPVDLIDEALSKSIFISEGFRYGARSAFYYMAFAESLTWPAHHCCDVLLGDRGLDSLCVYQGSFASGRGGQFDPVAAVAALEQLHREMRFPCPDLTLLLVMDERTITRRFAERHDRPPTARETRTLLDLQRMYGRLANAFDRFRVLDANSTHEAVAQEAVSVVCNRLSDG
jgi:thymidylate kinase